MSSGWVMTTESCAHVLQLLDDLVEHASEHDSPTTMLEQTACTPSLVLTPPDEPPPVDYHPQAINDDVTCLMVVDLPPGRKKRASHSPGRNKRASLENDDEPLEMERRSKRTCGREAVGSFSCEVIDWRQLQSQIFDFSVALDSLKVGTPSNMWHPFAAPLAL